MDDDHMQELEKLRQGHETHLLVGGVCSILERMCQLHQLQADENRYGLHEGASRSPRESKFDDLSGTLFVERLICRWNLDERRDDRPRYVRGKAHWVASSTRLMEQFQAMTTNLEGAPSWRR